MSDQVELSNVTPPEQLENRPPLSVILKNDDDFVFETEYRDLIKKYIEKDQYYKYAPIYCEVCKKNVCYYRWNGHTKSNVHLSGGIRSYNNESNLIKEKCEVCNIEISKNKMNLHIKSKKHQNGGVDIEKKPKIKEPKQTINSNSSPKNMFIEYSKEKILNSLVSELIKVMGAQEIAKNHI